MCVTGPWRPASPPAGSSGVVAVRTVVVPIRSDTAQTTLWTIATRATAGVVHFISNNSSSCLAIPSITFRSNRRVLFSKSLCNTYNILSHQKPLFVAGNS